MKHTWVLLLPLVLAACSHPLEIEGEGDIVSPGRAIYCTLEQQPCPNIVAGDYIRTYVGLPRPGWDFERWINCGTDKDKTYRWGGVTALGTGYGIYYADWNALVAGSNSEALCGFNNWRLPSPFELRSLVNFNRSNPSIDTAYFPNTVASNYCEGRAVDAAAD